MIRSTMRMIPTVVERERHRSSRPARSTKHPTGAVDHDLGDRRVGEERFERAEPGDLVGELTRRGVRAGPSTSSGSASCRRSPSRRRSSDAGDTHQLLHRLGADEALVHRAPERAGRHRATGAGAELTPPLHAGPRAARPRAARRRPAGRARRAGGARARRRRRRGRSHPGRHPGDHGAAQHVGDLLRADRPARLLDDDEPGGPGEGGMAHRPAQREVAAADDEDRHVGHLEQRARRGRVGRSGVDERRHRPVAERDGERGAGLRGGARSQRRRFGATGDQRDAGCGLDGEPVQRVGRSSGPGFEPVADAGAGSAPSPKIAGWSPPRSTRRAPGTAGEDERAGGGEHGRAGATLG